MILGTATAAAALITGCGGVSDALPASAVSKKATMVVRVSPTEIDSVRIRQSLDALASLALKSKVPQIVQGSGLLSLRSAGLDPAKNAEMKLLDDRCTEMKAAGIISVVAVIEDPSQMPGLDDISDAAAGDMVVALVQTDGRASGTEVGAIASRYAGEPVAAHSLGGGWYRLLPEADTRAVEVADSDPAAALELDAALKSIPLTAVNLGVRVTPEMRASITDGVANGGPMAAVASGFEDSLQAMIAIAGSVAFGADPTLKVQLSFSKPEAAEEFNDSWNQMLDGLAGMAAMFLAAPDKEGKRSVNPAVFATMADALHMKQDGSKLGLTLDKAGWAKLLP